MIDRAYYWDAIRTMGVSGYVLEPFISVLVPTYARTTHLAEAISSVLVQTYTNFEIVVCNDCGRQTLVHDDKEHVEMHNLSKQFQTLGEKRNFLLDHARGDIVCFLDDDDLLLPWHLWQIADLFLTYRCDAVRFSRALAYTRIERSIAWGSAPINVAVRRKVTPRFSSRSTGEDQDFRAALPNAIDVITDNPSYVYEWANGVFNLSTRDENTAREDFVREANKRMDEKQEPEGSIVLPFGFKDDVRDWFIP
jgi:glycosyltransferase involved in cell wall biosynthesis